MICVYRPKCPANIGALLLEELILVKGLFYYKRSYGLGYDAAPCVLVYVHPICIPLTYQ